MNRRDLLKNGAAMTVAAAVGAPMRRARATIGLLGGAPANGGGASWQLPAGHYLPANFSMQIIAPRSGLTIANRYYLAYPGLALTLPVCVIGGAWPFQYELSGAPSGMSIGQHYGDANYGVITWANPLAGTYSLTVTVTDQQGTQQSVSWTLTVQTANFIFVDSVNGNPSSANGGTGTGTISNPFKTVNDWYAGATGGTGSNTQSDATYAGYFVYYRGNTSNTYNLGACNYSTTNGQVYMSNKKPAVHLAYPGDPSPIFDVETDNISWFFPYNVSGIFIEGVTYNGAALATTYDTANIRWDSGATDIVVTGCTFQSPTTAPANSNNGSFCYSDNNSPNVTQYFAFVGNTIQGTNGYHAFLGYSTEYVLIENNSCSNVSGGVGNPGPGCFYAKDKTNSYWTVRYNTGLSGNSQSSLVEISDFSTVQYVEILWNNYVTAYGGVYLSFGDGGVVSDVVLGRNTWQHAGHDVTGQGNTSDTISVKNDVNQFTSSSATSHGWILNGNILEGATFAGEQCVGLNGAFVDSNGNLIPPYTSYDGTRGHQVA